MLSKKDANLFHDYCINNKTYAINLHLVIY